jgi:broad specificity phosphatase PhoE
VEPTPTQRADERTLSAPSSAGASSGAAARERSELSQATTLTYLARHGETASNVLRCYAGSSAEPLTPLGQTQVRSLAARLGHYGISEIWTSEVARARQSAEIVAAALGVGVRADARLNEMRMGPWEGLTEDEVAVRYPDDYQTWLTSPDRLRLPGRETLETLADRVMEAVRDAVQTPRTVLLMTHVAPIRVAALRTLEVPLDRYKRLCVRNVDCLAVDLAVAEVRRLGEARSLRHEIGDGALKHAE